MEKAEFLNNIEGNFNSKIRNITIGLKGEPEEIIDRKIVFTTTSKEFHPINEGSYLNSIGELKNYQSINGVEESKRKQSPEFNKNKESIQLLSDDELDFDSSDCKLFFIFYFFLKKN